METNDREKRAIDNNLEHFLRVSMKGRAVFINDLARLNYVPESEAFASMKRLEWEGKVYQVAGGPEGKTAWRAVSHP